MAIDTIVTNAIANDAVNAANGMLVYNSNLLKIQAYANGTWVNLH